jgi:hypothetical protein
MQRLQAEESMRGSTQVAVGTGSLADGKGTQVMNQWRAIAHPQDVPASAAIDAVERRRQALKAAGVKVFGTEG